MTPNSTPSATMATSAMSGTDDRQRQHPHLTIPPHATTVSARLSDRMTPPPPFRYQARQSRLDREHMAATKEQFRGFITLFWIAMACYVLLTTVRNVTERGILLGGTLYDIFSTDALMLTCSDVVMVSYTLLAVPWAWLDARGWLHPTVFIAVQTLYEMSFVVGAVWWVHWRNWPWIQTTFFVLHSMVMMMKVHSYLYRNHEMAQMRHRATILRRWLDQRSESVSSHASITEEEEDEDDSMLLSSDSVDGLSPEVNTPHASSSGARISEGIARARRRRQIASDALTEPATPLQQPVPVRLVSASAPPTCTSEETPNQSKQKSYFTSRRPMPSALLMDLILAEKRHPRAAHTASDALLSSDTMDSIQVDAADAQHELDELESDLCPSTRPYPRNVTFCNYLDYLIIPTLVYELEYPRTHRIRPAYVFEKFAAIMGTFTLMYITVEHYVVPALQQTAHLPLWSALPQLLFPVLVVFLLSFFIVFEFICNAFAELSRFADRSFYDDWWNSTTFEEFARNWNKPVHHFLLRHVYVPLYRDYGMSRYRASLITFLLSSLFHELAIAVVCGHLRLYLFCMQMLQIPLIWMTKAVGKRGQDAIGNWFFWFGMAIGPPLLLCMYCREFVQPERSIGAMLLGTSQPLLT